MKVYVDKGKLESHDIQSITDLGGKEFQQVIMWFKDTDNVEIVPLADYTRQVRKEVCEEIKKFAYDTFKEFGCFDEVDLEHIFDQIQGETKCY